MNRFEFFRRNIAAGLLCLLSPFVTTHAAAQIGAGGALGGESNQVAAPKSAPAGSAVVGQKRRVLRIGLRTPTVQFQDAAAAVTAVPDIQRIVEQSMSGPLLTVVPLTTRNEVQSEAEVKEKECDYILYISVSQKRKTGKLGGWIRKAAPIVGTIVPGVGIATAAAGAMGGAAASTAAAQTMTGLSSLIKEKDEITLEYRLTTANGEATSIAQTVPATATSNGEDVLTRLVDQAASTILKELVQK